MATPAAPIEQIINAPFEGDDAQAPPPEPEAKPAEAEKPAEAPPVKASKDDTSDIRARIAELERTNRELAESERYWADRAKSGRGSEDERPKETHEPVKKLTPAEVVDRFTEQGMDFIIDELRRQGYVLTKEDVTSVAEDVTQRVAQHERRKYTVDDQLRSEYPELRDESSELFQETREILRQRVEMDPALAKSPAALLMAAETAKLRLAAKKPARKSVPDYRDENETADIEGVGRRRRIASQQGDLGRDAHTTPFEGDEDDFGPEARDVVNLFARAGVDERSYRAARAKDRRRS